MHSDQRGQFSRRVARTSVSDNFLQNEFSELRVGSGTRGGSSGSSNSRAVFGNVASRSQSAGPIARNGEQHQYVPHSWKPTKVTVYNFCEFGSDAGALTRKERDEKGAFILSKLPPEAVSGVSLEKKYSLSRQLVFNCEKGGEECWILREAILAMKDLEIKGFKVPDLEDAGANQVHLKVRVEDHPDRREKRGLFFRALRALEKQFPPEVHEAKQIIVDVRFF